MNETRVFADGYHGVFQKQDDFLDCLKAWGGILSGKGGTIKRLIREEMRKTGKTPPAWMQYIYIAIVQKSKRLKKILKFVSSSC
ncbi:MAG: hypothetical protein K2O91_02665 [Lachnospiraceae bacterium]|nr:hypothetical protein [Lachnospiraceae bacterium]